MSTLCIDLPERNSSSFNGPNEVYAAGNELRTWILPPGMYEMLRSMSDRRYQADNKGGEVGYTDWSRRLG